MAASLDRVSAAVPLSMRASRGHSCFFCYQRKVKCDGKRPCSRCTKSGAECRSERPSRSPRPGVRGSAAANSGLLVRLRRYEKLLVAHGVRFEGKFGDDDDEGMKDTGACSPANESEDGRVIVRGGNPRFVDNALWTGLGVELHLADDLPDTAEDEPYRSFLADDIPPSADTLVFGRPTFVPLGSLHPTVPEIMLLWQTFLNNFNPLVKLFHAPTVQNVISEATADLESISPNTEALMFAVYLCAATTMSEEQCLRLLSASKAAALAKFSHAAQQALVNAKFLKTTDLVVLQALTLYLLSSRRSLDPQSLWLLSGLAHRLAETMGIHKEASLQTLLPFEAEIRRRLWWQILIIESRSALLSGVTTDGAFSTSWDTKRPLNINDSDLSPLMREPPAEHGGITEMLFCTIRFEVGDTMRKLKKRAMADDEKSRLIDDLEARLDPLIRKCDPSIPLHLLSMFMGRSAIAQMRLLAGNRLWHCNGSLATAPLERGERDRQFELALQILGYDSMGHSNRAIQPFLWHVGLQFPFESFILVLTELLTRTEGEDVDRAWMRVNQAYEDHPELVAATENPLYVAMGNLAVKAWERRMGAVDRERLDVHPVESHAICRLREQREQRGASREKKRKKHQHQQQQQPQPARDSATENGISEASPMDMDHFDAFFIDVEDLGWDDWQGLLRGGESEGGFRL